MKKRIAVQGALFTSAALLCLFLPKVFFPVWTDFWKEELFDLIGLLCVMMGLLIRISARGHKSEQSQVSHRLVTDQIYAFVRNPMYFGSFLIGLGLNIGLFNLWIFLCYISVYLYMYIREVKKEQKFLSEQFLMEYKEYCQKVPLFFPKIISILQLNRFLIIKKKWLKRELNLVISIFAVFFILELWQDAPSLEWDLILEEFVELIALVLSFMFFVKVFWIDDR